jgi:uncharacterized glyoxalase superfamily protein PhnB
MSPVGRAIERAVFLATSLPINARHPSRGLCASKADGRDHGPGGRSSGIDTPISFGMCQRISHIKRALADGREQNMQVFPIFAVANIEDALDFYCRKLGFETKWIFGDPPHRAGVAKQGVEIHLDAEAAGAPPGPSVIYCHMDDVTAYFHDLQSRGVAFVFELQDRPWGMRDFRIEDPFGNRLGFASKI